MYKRQFPYFLQFQNSSAQETYTFFWYHRDILPKSNKGNNQTHLLYCKPPSFIKFLFSSHIRSCTGCWCFRDVLTRKDTLNAYSVLVSLWAGCFVFKVRVRSKKDSYTKRNAQRSFYSPLTASFLISCHLFKVPYTISVLTKQNTDMFWNCFLQNTILVFKVKNKPQETF